MTKGFLVAVDKKPTPENYMPRVDFAKNMSDIVSLQLQDELTTFQENLNAADFCSSSKATHVAKAMSRSCAGL